MFFFPLPSHQTINCTYTPRQTDMLPYTLNERCSCAPAHTVGLHNRPGVLPNQSVCWCFSVCFLVRRTDRVWLQPIWFFYNVWLIMSLCSSGFVNPNNLYKKIHLWNPTLFTIENCLSDQTHWLKFQWFCPLNYFSVKESINEIQLLLLYKTICMG